MKVRPRHLPALLLFLSWALWIGGIFSLFVFAQVLFRHFPREQSAVAIDAAPVLFRTFGFAQLILAAVAILATIAWRRKKLSKGLGLSVIGMALGLAMIGAILLATLVVPKMDAMRLAGRTREATWGVLHGLSMVIYVFEALVLLMIAPLLMRAINGLR